jgi:DNA polymerase III subunit gamma/tau
VSALAYTSPVAQEFLDIPSHQAIYRRFRAQTFAQIVGQEPVVETLRNAVRLGRLGHGFLFVGPRGTGKTSMARILAKAVNCTNPLDGEPDDACVSCVSIREGRALDVIELDAASNNRVDDMRELLPRVYTSASDLRRKVFIIDEVQRIKEGWDVLLKTLEEPPEGVLFIFCTTDPSQIRPAVVSRLQRFTFRPLSVAEIEGKLRRILASEGRTAEPDAIALVAELAAGGMRDAESMLDQVLSNADDPITASTIRDLLGLAEQPAVDRFIEALADDDVLVGIAVLDQLEADGRDVVSFAEQVVSALRTEMVERLRSGSDVSKLAVAARRLTGIDASRSGLGGYRWQLELALLSSAGAGGVMAAGKPAGSGRTVTPEVARPGAPAAKPTAPVRQPEPVAPQPAEPVAPPIAAPRALREAPEPAREVPEPEREAPEPAPEPVAVPIERPEVSIPPAMVSVSAAGSGSDDLFGTIRSHWNDVLSGLPSPASNRPVFNESRPVEIRDGVLILGFPENRAFLREKAEDPKRRQALEQALEHVIGRPIGVRCVVANVEALEPLPQATDDDLVAVARRVFADDLAPVDDIT